MPKTIRAVSLTCPSCGAPLPQDMDGNSQIICEYCGTVNYISDDSDDDRATPPRSIPDSDNVPDDEPVPQPDPYMPEPVADGEYFPSPDVIFTSHAEQVFNEGRLELRRDGLYYVHGGDEDCFEYQKITELKKGSDNSFQFDYPGSWFGELFQRCDEYKTWIKLIKNARDGNFPEG